MALSSHRPRLVPRPHEEIDDIAAGLQRVDRVIALGEVLIDSEVIASVGEEDGVKASRVRGEVFDDVALCEGDAIQARSDELVVARLQVWRGGEAE